MNRCSLAFAASLAFNAAAQVPDCQVPASDSPVAAKARRIIQDLPETTRWARSHHFPVAYVGVFSPLLKSGKCYLAVGVYADRPERLEPWNHFYVDVQSEVVLVVEPINGDVISLQEWRSGAKPKP